MMNNDRQGNGPEDAVSNGHRANGGIDSAVAETVPKQELKLEALGPTAVMQSSRIAVREGSGSQFPSGRAETSAHNQISGVNEEICPPLNNEEQQPMDIELNQQPLPVVEPKTNGPLNFSPEAQNKPTMNSPQGFGIEITSPTLPAINDHDATDGAEDVPADHPVVVYPTTVLSIPDILHQNPISGDIPITTSIFVAPVCVFINEEDDSEGSQTAQQDAELDPVVQELAASCTNNLTLSSEEKTEGDKKDGTEKPNDVDMEDASENPKQDDMKDKADKLEVGKKDETDELEGDDESEEDDEEEEESDEDFNFELLLDTIPDTNSTGIKRLDVSAYGKLRRIKDSHCPDFEFLITEGLAVATEENTTKSNIFEYIISNHLFSISIRQAYGIYIDTLKRMIIERKLTLTKKEDGQFYFQLRRLNPPMAANVRKVPNAFQHPKNDPDDDTTSTTSTHYLGTFPGN